MDREKVKTFGLKLSELRPCDNCSGKVSPFFYHIQIRHAIVNPRNANSVLGLMTMCGWPGRALGIAEVMAPGADKAVEVLDEPESVETLFICQDCFLGLDGKGLNIPMLMERRASAREREEEKTHGHERNVQVPEEGGEGRTDIRAEGTGQVRTGSGDDVGSSGASCGESEGEGGRGVGAVEKNAGVAEAAPLENS